MKLFLLSALVASSVAKEVQIDFDKLVSHSEVSYDKVDCGEWDDYVCCSSKHNCDKLKKGGDKKEAKKREKERKDYCVHKDETCCGSDISYNWKVQRSDGDTKKAVEHDHKKKKNVKGCDKEEVCIASDLLKHSKSKTEIGEHDGNFKFVVKEMIGHKSKTSCVKKDKLDKKKADKYNKKYSKKVAKEKKNSDIEFEENVKIMSIQDHHHQCGNFDKEVFKCCSPDENFCKQISATDKNKWCVKEEDQCCLDFKYYEADRSMIKLDIDEKDDKTWASSTACKKSGTKNNCVYDKHDKKDFSVTTKCVSKKVAKKNKKRGSIKVGGKEEDDGQSLIDLLTGGGQQEEPQNPFLGLF